MTSIVSRRAAHREAATAPVATAETPAAATSASTSLFAGRAAIITRPLWNVLKRLPFIFLVRQDRGDTRPNASAACRGSSNVCLTLLTKTVVESYTRVKISPRITRASIFLSIDTIPFCAAMAVQRAGKVSV